MNLLEREHVKKKECGTWKRANPMNQSNSSIVDQNLFGQGKRDWSCLQTAVRTLTLESGCEMERARRNSEELRLPLRRSEPPTQPSGKCQVLRW